MCLIKLVDNPVYIPEFHKLFSGFFTVKQNRYGCFNRDLKCFCVGSLMRRAKGIQRKWKKESTFWKYCHGIDWKQSVPRDAMPIQREYCLSALVAICYWRTQYILTGHFEITFYWIFRFIFFKCCEWIKMKMWCIKASCMYIFWYGPKK